MNSEIQKLLKGIIDKRKKAMEAGEPAKDDLLGILMDSSMKELQRFGSPKQQLGMSYQDMIDECKLFYFAGQETTSVLLVWTMILLSKYQDWQTRAREEILATFGDNQPNFDGLQHLKIVSNVVVIFIMESSNSNESNWLLISLLRAGDDDTTRGAKIVPSSSFRQS